MTFKRLMILLAALVATILTSIGLLAAASMSHLTGAQEKASSEAIFYARALNESRQAQVSFQRQVQEWKNILIRGNDQEQYDKYWKSFQEHEAKAQAAMASLQAQMKEHRESLPEIATLIDEHSKLGTKYREALATWDGANPEAGKAVDKLLRGIDRPASAAMDEVGKKIEAMVASRLDVIKADSISYANKLQLVFAACAVFLLFAAMFLCWKISRIVLGRVGVEPVQLEEIFRRVAKGDLSVAMEISPDDDSSVAAHAQLMIIRIRSMIRAVKNNASEVSDSSAKVDMGADINQMKSALRDAKVAVSGLEAAMSRFKV